MKRVSFLILLPLITVLSVSNFAQSNFNIEVYKQFLESNQNMTTEELLQMHPAGLFAGDQNLALTDTRYLDSISIKYGLTAHELELLSQNGFVVSERMKKIAFGDAFMDIFHKDLPVYISTDAILHPLHISYDRILKDVELGITIDRLKSMLQAMHNQQSVLASNYSAYPEMQTMLKDVDVYSTIPLKLLGLNVNPYYPSNQSLVSLIMAEIESEEADTLSLFSTNCKWIDWSQFKIRGHYTDDPELGKYFQAMIWLGRTELYLAKPNAMAAPPCEMQTFHDVQRQIIDAFLIYELFEISNSTLVYEEIEDIIKFFVGEQDNVTIDNLEYLKNAINLNNLSELLDSIKVVEFQDTLANQPFANQLILSQMLWSNPMTPDSIIPASAFMLFGQRFVIDSYVTATVVYDKIKYFEQEPCRLIPSTLDVLFSLGNDASIQLLQSELNEWHYSTNLAALRYLIDTYDGSFWNSSLYNIWLNSIRELNPIEDRSSLPPFMQTAAFWQKMMNTQLSSWTELRHDNLLYAKQSYSGGTICSYPYGYVEPFPEFYNGLKNFAQIASTKLQTLNFPDPGYQQGLVNYFNHLNKCADTLMNISNKELNKLPLNQQEIYFLKKLIYETMTSGQFLDGWYVNLYYNDAFSTNDPNGGGVYGGLLESDHLVADIHSAPFDCTGGMPGYVVHVGTGSINLGVFVANAYDSIQTAYVGPVTSYYEYITEDFLRLTDEEWDNQYLQSAVRPEWVNIYLADSTGNSRGEGPSLITSVDDDPNKTINPQSELLISNYPNPFNATTLIVFTIPYHLTNEYVELKVYDVQGSLIATLVNENLSAGNYIVKWAGKNDNLQNVASGIYFYNIKVGEQVKSGKMNLLK
jgi:hypothetical protein